MTMLHARRFLSSCLSLAMVTACNPGAPTHTAGTPAEKPPADAAPTLAGTPVTDPVAELTAVYGPAGARTENLAEGTFLGAGAKLRAGEVLMVPRGTLAELRLLDGTVLRINEDSRIMLPDAPRSRGLELRSGEVVAIVADGQPPLTIKAGEDTLEVAAGEAHALARGGKRSYDVVYGAATLRSGDQSVALTPGAHVETPLVPAQPVEPEISLRPLEDTAWSRTFEIASAMADAVPPGSAA
jgi:ferric-dicitrate binding protein FerR (iron transport regulator)